MKRYGIAADRSLYVATHDNLLRDQGTRDACPFADDDVLGVDVALHLALDLHLALGFKVAGDGETRTITVAASFPLPLGAGRGLWLAACTVVGGSPRLAVSSGFFVNIRDVTPGTTLVADAVLIRSCHDDTKGAGGAACFRSDREPITCALLSMLSPQCADSPCENSSPVLPFYRHRVKP